jgi:hypothetical protein
MAEKQPSQAQQDALMEIMSSGHGMNVRLNTFAALARQGWIVGREKDGPLYAKTWRRLQVSDDMVRWFKEHNPERLEFRIHLLHQTAAQWDARPFTKSVISDRWVDRRRNVLLTPEQVLEAGLGRRESVPA